MLLEVGFRDIGDITILDLSGSLRAGVDIVDFRHAINRLITDGRLSVVGNLEKIGKVDSSGLGELIAGFATLKRCGGTLKLLNLNNSVVELMMMTKLLTIFEVFENETDAIESFTTDSGRPELANAGDSLIDPNPRVSQSGSRN